MQQKKSILLLGAGGHARSCIDVIEEQGLYQIVGLIGVESERGASVFGYPVLGTDAELPELLKRYDAGLVTIGQIKDFEPRIQLFEQLFESGRAQPPIISPHAHVSRHAVVGDGTIVLHGAIVNAGASVGRNCIINSLAIVEHDAAVGDHCHISTGARLNSSVVIGEGSFVGSGVTIKQGVRIGRHCVVGMGLSVRRDCPDGTIQPA